MREFVANFQQKHGQQVPMPKIYGDEDSSDSEGLELADGTKGGKKTAGGAGGSGGGKPRKKPAASSGTSTGGGGSDGASTSGGGGIGGSGGDDPGRGRKRSRGDDGDDPNKRRKTGGEGGPPRPTWPVKNHIKWAQLIPQSIKSCQSFTSLTRRREPCWAIACWTGLQRSLELSTR